MFLFFTSLLMKKFLFLFGTNCFLFGAITLAGTIDDAVNWAYENDLTVFNTPTSF